jgi:DNA recombination protein RmuC
MDPIVGVLIGLAAGGVIGYLWARGGAATAAERARAAEDERARLETQLSDERTARTAAESDREAARARADESEKRVQERDQFIKGFVETSRGDQQNAYAKLSQAALEATTKQFLELANQTLQATARGAAGDLEVRKKEIEGLLAPMRDELGKLASAANAMEQKRSEAYGTIQQLVSSLSGQAQRLEKQTLDLTSALRGSSQARGRWGEAQFRRIVELAGMLEHCDFDEQKEASDGSRPDAIVHLPGERTIAIDAKAPLSAYFEAVELAEPAARAEALARHAAAVRGHVKALSQRNYPEQLENSVDFVVMFLPGDSLLAAAFEGDPDVWETAARARVLIATPVTLIALLRTCALYWQQNALAENAKQIAGAASEFYDRVATFSEHLDGVGQGLAKAADAYRRAVGSFNTRILPSGARLKELGAAANTKKTIEELKPVDTPLRELRSGE